MQSLCGPEPTIPYATLLYKGKPVHSDLHKHFVCVIVFPKQTQLHSGEAAECCTYNTLLDWRPRLHNQDCDH